MLSALDLLFIASYFILILIVGLCFARKETKEDYLIGGRKLKTLSSAFTITASKVGGGLLLTYTALVYVYGLAALWFFMGIVFGYVIFYFFAKKLKKLSDQKKYYTLPDFFFDQYGKLAGYIAAIIVFVTMFGWVIVNFIGGAKILENFTTISFETSTALVGMVILAYLLVGGFKAVVKTDSIQLFGILILFILMVYLLVSNPTALHNADFNLFSISIGSIISFFLAGVLFPMASAELWQRVYAVKDEQTLKKSLITASALYVTIGVFLLFIGLVIRNSFIGIDPDNSLILGLSRLLPSGFSGLAIVVFYSAIMSSADTFLFTANATFNSGHSTQIK